MSCWYSDTHRWIPLRPVGRTCDNNFKFITLWRLPLSLRGVTLASHPHCSSIQTGWVFYIGLGWDVFCFENPENRRNSSSNFDSKGMNCIHRMSNTASFVSLLRQFSILCHSWRDGACDSVWLLLTRAMFLLDYPYCL